MLETKQYTVALNAFQLVLPADSLIWNRLNNLHPFLSAKGDSKSIVFSLTVSEFYLDKQAFTPVLSNQQQDDDIIGMNIYKNDKSDYLFEISLKRDEHVNGRLLVEMNGRQAKLQLSGNEAEMAFTLNRSLMLAYMLYTARYDTLLMHSSVILNDGKGYLFMGKSGTGKSTHTALWLKYISGSELMNDDNPVIRIIDGIPMVFGSPWSGKTPCYRNVEAPIGGFVRLKQAKENRIKRLNTIESYASLLTSSSGMSWETMLADAKDHTIQEFISKVPCWLLECLPDEAAARLSAGTIRKEISCPD